MAAPTFRAAGAKSAGTTSAVTVTAPTGVATGDLEILIAESTAAGTVSITSDGGGAWTAMTGSPVTLASAPDLYVWWRIRAGGDGNPAVTATTDHVCAARLAYTAGTFDTSDPFELETTSSENTSDTSFSWAPGGTTGGTDRLVLVISTIVRDSNTGSVPVCTNASLTSLASRADYCTNLGGTTTSGGFGVTEGTKAAAGTIGTFANTYSAASLKTYMAFAIKPALTQARVSFVEVELPPAELADNYTGTATISGGGATTAVGTAATTDRQARVSFVEVELPPAEFTDNTTGTATITGGGDITEVHTSNNNVTISISGPGHVIATGAQSPPSTQVRLSFVEVQLPPAEFIETHSGTATITGGGSPGTTVVAEGVFTPSLTEHGRMLHYALGMTNDEVGTAIFEGVTEYGHMVSGNPPAERFGSASVTAHAQATETHTSARTQTVAISGGGPITATGTQAIASEEHSGSASLSGGGTVSATGTKQATRTQAISGGGTVVASGVKGAIRTQAISGGGLVTATGTKQARPAVVISGNGSVIASTTAQHTGATSIHGGGTVVHTQIPQHLGTATISAGGSVVASGAGGATIHGGGTVVASGSKQVLGEAILISAEPQITTTGSHGGSGTVVVSGGGSVAGVGGHVFLGSVTVSGRGLVTVIGHKGISSAVAITGGGVVDVDGGGGVQVLISGGGSITVTTVSELLAEATPLLTATFEPVVSYRTRTRLLVG